MSTAEVATNGTSNTRIICRDRVRTAQTSNKKISWSLFCSTNVAHFSLYLFARYCRHVGGRFAEADKG